MSSVESARARVEREDGHSYSKSEFFGRELHADVIAELLVRFADGRRQREACVRAGVHALGRRVQPRARQRHRVRPARRTVPAQAPGHRRRKRIGSRAAGRARMALALMGACIPRRLVRVKANPASASDGVVAQGPRRHFLAIPPPGWLGRAQGERESTLGWLFWRAHFAEDCRRKRTRGPQHAHGSARDGTAGANRLAPCFSQSSRPRSCCPSARPGCCASAAYHTHRLD
jgi:hypothetical protein